MHNREGTKLGSPDPLVAALAGAKKGKCGRTLRIVELFGDRPDVLQAIRDARDRGASARTIAELLSTPEEPICSGSVTEWLRRQR